MNDNEPGGVSSSVLETIGANPLVALSRLTDGLPGRILLKLEFMNPGLSKKDRVALRMIEDAERDGSLRPGQTVVELTSGNTGTGLAIVCAVKKHPFVAVMSAGNSIERARMMRALGAEVVIVEQQPGSTPGQVSGADLELVEEHMRRIVMERGAFRADQFMLPAKVSCHYDGTGPEILAQTSGRIDAFCDFVGSAGSFAGCARRFKEHDPAIKCYVVEPAGAAVLAGHEVTNANHRIQGGGYAMAELRFLDPADIDGFMTVTDEEAMATARALAIKEGIFGGFSTGANVAAALRLLKGPCAGGTIIALACDSEMKYLSTDLWN